MFDYPQLGEIPSKVDIPPPTEEEACIALAKPAKPKGRFKSADSEKRFKQYVRVDYTFRTIIAILILNSYYLSRSWTTSRVRERQFSTKSIIESFNDEWI